MHLIRKTRRAQARKLFSIKQHTSTIGGLQGHSSVTLQQDCDISAPISMLKETLSTYTGEEKTKVSKVNLQYVCATRGGEGERRKVTQITTHLLKTPLVNPNEEDGEGTEDPGFTSTSDYAKNKTVLVYRGIFKG